MSRDLPQQYVLTTFDSTIRLQSDWEVKLNYADLSRTFLKDWTESKLPEEYAYFSTYVEMHGDKAPCGVMVSDQTIQEAREDIASMVDGFMQPHLASPKANSHTLKWLFTHASLQRLAALPELMGLSNRL